MVSREVSKPRRGTPVTRADHVLTSGYDWSVLVGHVRRQCRRRFARPDRNKKVSSEGPALFAASCLHARTSACASRMARISRRGEPPMRSANSVVCAVSAHRGHRRELRRPQAGCVSKPGFCTAEFGSAQRGKDIFGAASGSDLALRNDTFRRGSRTSLVCDWMDFPLGIGVAKARGSC